jgi:gas vesicle protein
MANNMLKHMVVGSLVGAAVSLFNKNTRENAKSRAVKMRTKTTSLVNTLKEDPAKISQDVKEFSSNVRTLVNDINKDVKDVLGKMDEIKKNSTKTVESAREAGGELKEIGGKLKHAGEEMNENKKVAENTDVHQQL